jgi:hypothetical protein
VSGGWRERLARELAGEALFDEGVEAARNACVAGASIAAAAITAAAWYDNPLTGVTALTRCMRQLEALPLDLEAWCLGLRGEIDPEIGDAPVTPGFGFVSAAQDESIRAACQRLVAAAGPGEDPARARFFLRHHAAIGAVSGPLNQAGLAALCFVDHGVDRDQAERWFMVWRIETAVAEAQRARQRGLAAFPFFTEQHVYEGARPAPAPPWDMDDLMRKVGLPLG